MMQQILNRFPGISCAYADTAGKDTAEQFGFADRERNIPVTEDTVFPACSMSKFVTALCLMKLQEEKAIDLDAPVNRYLKNWKLRTPDGAESDAQIRSVLRHTAGIVDGEDSFYGLRRGDPEVKLMDILEGKTFYNSRPARAEKPQDTEFAYSDAGYCVLQLLVEEVTRKPFEDAVREILFDRLGLQKTFYASAKNLEYFEQNETMATGYDGEGLPLAGRFPPCPDLAGAGLWTTPKELLTIAKEFVAAYNGKSILLQEDSAKEMAAPAEKFPWAGLGLFVNENGTLMTQGWGEHGQCMLKMHCRTGRISVVMTNRNPEQEQAESGVEWLVDKHLLAD